MTCFRMSDGTPLRKYCRDTGLNYTTMYHRCDALGMSPDEAVAQAPLKQKNIHWINGYSLKAACEMVGVNYQIVIDHKRLHKLPIEESFKAILLRNPLTSQQKRAIKLLGGDYYG